MSHDEHAEPVYNQTMINAWTGLSVLIAGIVFICFCFGQEFLHVGHWIWDLVRWICLPII